MSQQIIYANPFRQWAEMLRDLRTTYVTELGFMKDPKLLKPAIGEVLGALNGLINDCEAIAPMVEGLQRTDLEAFEAFQRCQDLIRTICEAGHAIAQMRTIS